MTPNEIRDLKEIAAGRAPVGSGPRAFATAILELFLRVSALEHAAANAPAAEPEPEPSEPTKGEVL